jgi:hypothetical protein
MRFKLRSLLIVIGATARVLKIPSCLEVILEFVQDTTH